MNSYHYNAIQQNPYGNIATAEDKMAAYQYGSRILGTMVAYNRLSKGKDTKDAGPALKLLFALVIGGSFPLPYLAYVAYDTYTKKKGQ